jgi:hypothetical protein
MAQPVKASAKQAGDDPAELHPDVLAMRQRAQLAKTLMGGTAAMRAAGQLYLPKMRREDDETYADRLAITVLRNYYRQALSALAGKLMRNGLKLEEAGEAKAPPEMADWLRDLDCCGTPGDVLFKRVFTWAVRDAAAWLLADYPPTGGAQSLADEREQGIRPYLIPISLWDALGWREERIGGRHHVTQFRYLMTSEEPVGQFGSQIVETVRVIEPTTIRDFRKAKGGWELYGDEMVNTLGRVPIHRIASDMDENLIPRGGMEDLAWLNLEHWQIRSDQRLTLRVNSFPILFAAGMETIPPVGPEGAVAAQDPAAKLTFVESGGTNLAAGRQELLDLEDTMRSVGAQYQVRQIQKTATASQIDAREASAPAQGWAINCKRGFEAAMDDMAELAGKGKGSGAGGSLRVDTDALVSSMDVQQLQILQTARAQREISRETFLAALKRADLLPDDFSAENDAELLEMEGGPDLAGME